MAAAGRPLEIWFQDEARIGQKGGHAYIWAPVGSRPLMVRGNRHVDGIKLLAATTPHRGGHVPPSRPGRLTAGLKAPLKAPASGRPP